MSKTREYKEIYNGIAKLTVGNIQNCDKVIFFNTTFWIQPTEDRESYKKDILSVEKLYTININKELINTEQNLFSDKYIYSFECKYEHMEKNKKTFISMETLLRQKYNIKFSNIHDELMNNYKKVIKAVTDKFQSMHYNIYASIKR